MKTPEEIIEYFCIDHPNEIDLDAICFHFKAKVERRSLSGCEGRLIGFKERAIITVNSSSSKKRQRFTAGHELCHWLNDKGNVSHRCTEKTLLNAWSNDNAETRANNFSAKLLMPESLLRKLGKGKNFTIKDMIKLAEMFGVSLTAMAIRFLKLDLASGMLIWSDGNERSRFTTNPSYQKRAWPIKLIDKESCAAFVKEKETGSKYGCSIPADIWIDSATASHYELYEDSIVVMNGVILSLISWPDEGYLISLAEN